MSTQPASEMERIAEEHLDLADEIYAKFWVNRAQAMHIADFILARDAERSRIAAPQVEADRLSAFIHEG